MKRRWVLIVVPCMLACVTIGGEEAAPAQYGAPAPYWVQVTDTPAPTSTPLPTATYIPTATRAYPTPLPAETPENDMTPYLTNTPPNDPHWPPTAIPTATPQPTPTPTPTNTPYYRQSKFFGGQKVWWGGLVVSLLGYTKGRSCGEGIDHIFTFAIENISENTISFSLDDRALITEVQQGKDATRGEWTATAESMERGGYAPPQWPAGEHKKMVLVICAPQGQATGLGFVTGVAAQSIVWFTIERDPLQRHMEQAAERPPPPTREVDALLTRAGWPVRGPFIISRGFGCSAFWAPATNDACPAGQKYWHTGLDIVAAEGTAIYSLQGTVLAAQADTEIYCGAIAGSKPPHFGYGLYIRQLTASNLLIYYAHLSRMDVYAGQKVGEGAVIGAMGSTGCSSGTHLHFEIHRSGQAIDPFLVIAAPDKQ